MRTKRLLAVLAILALLILSGLAACRQTQVDDTRSVSLWTNFRNVRVDHDLDVNGDADIDGTLNADAVDLEDSLTLSSNNYPLEYATAGYELVAGATSSTATTVISGHGLSAPLYGTCTISGTLTDDEEQKCSLAISGSTVTSYVYKEAGGAADSAVTVLWILIGTP